MAESTLETPNSEIVPSQPDGLSRRSSILNRLISGRKGEQERLVALTEQVVNKLMKDLSEGGRVSLFYKKSTGELDSAMCVVYLKSRKIPSLRVDLHGETTPPTQSSMEFHKHFFGVTRERKFISAIERSPSKTKRAIAVIQRWDMPEGGYEINYRRDADIEDSNNSIPRSNGEKIKFLKEILETTVDPVATSEPFGRLYVPGDTYGGRGTSDGCTHHAYWMRDLKKQLPSLPDLVQPKLTK